MEAILETPTGKVTAVAQRPPRRTTKIAQAVRTACADKRASQCARILFVMLALTCSRVFAQEVVDRVRTTLGPEVGEITKMTPVALTIAKKSGSTSQVSVNEVRDVSFDGEPSDLVQIRARMDSGNFVEAAEMLAKVKPAGVRRDYAKQEIEFLQAECAAKLALGGRGTINDAGRLLNAFVRDHPQNFHYFEAVSLMGDLLAADGRVDLAQKQYNDLAESPWPEYKMHAAVAIGRALKAQGKHDEAIAQFDIALAIAGTDAKSQHEKLSATLGKAISLSQTGKLEAAVDMIQNVIQQSDPEQKELHAIAYNALGTCYQKAGQTKDALLAFLHVDLLYNTVPEAHAEALANLAPLFRAVGQEARAREARQTLEERYPNSRWAK